METLTRYLSEFRPLVDKKIMEVLEGSPKELYEAARHLPSKGGKRLRPALVLLVNKALGGEVEGALPAAAAVELLHNFTLVHDDIMDRDELRRGVPTVHVLYGESMAILAGDLLYAKAYEALLQSPQPPDLVKEMTEVLTWSAVTVAEGQAMDMEFEKRWDVTEEEYLEMIEKKTGALFGASAALGALTANKREVKDLMKEFGLILGKAFQIKDDVLSLLGDEKVTGKPKYNDLREGKKTILVIYALRNLPRDEAERVKSVLGRETSYEALEEVAELIKRSGALDYAMKLAEEFEKRAYEILETVRFEDEEAMRALKELVDFAVKREY
ncbi:polyprenyl synthetase family protein [Ignicoccus hospitalis]|uniref:Polyprenyl synthetase n=1 Tax=Ignicoccus hospitalis (strain KIN4/I / DSM 18386 / JCM 14125) TaxID=453591 RepID=A8ABP3_IGNH4|nr:polyprenyl synthetase family protein [Ignicoccus hospitalis]ABU82345.1 Polyprenyl synthetase [Ignicoccus hospitalis KIN4/I]